MSKIVVFLPKEDMLAQAERVIANKEIEIAEVKVVKTHETVNEARNALENGATILVARGVQAQYIREYTNAPVVEIVMTGQEISLILSKAKKLLNKDNPTIAICGLKNMFSDTTYYNEIFDIDLRMYLVDYIEELPNITRTAIADNVDIIIGGDFVKTVANENNMEFLFLDSTEDSILKALNTVSKMAYTEEIVKNHVADFETVLDSAVQAIIKIDKNKNITVINKMSEELFGVRNDVVVGNPVEALIPELRDEYLESVLASKRDVFSISIKIDSIPTMLTVLPIENKDGVLGAIVTCYRLNIVNKFENNIYRSMHLKGFVTDSTFESINVKDKKLKKSVELAKIYALSRNPILIKGAMGTEKEYFAQCIHNSSVYKNGPFVSINCAGMSEQRQIELLFGFFENVNNNEENSNQQIAALEASNGGTLFISEIDKLSMLCQYRLFRAIQYKSLIQNDLERTQTIDNRIIVSSSIRLEEKVELGEFREDLYFLLNSLVLEIPNLNERENDIEEIVNLKLTEFSKGYSKFLRLSEGAMQQIKNYEWKGNIIQLESFCERLFLTTTKKLISEEYVTNLLEELYPKIELKNGEKKIVIYKNPDAEKILGLLERHHGNRSKVAEELDISTTTLWRRMKKYGVADN